MIFQYTWEPVLAGAKTQTRRTVKPGDQLVDDEPGIAVISGKGRLRWRVGQVIAVQPERTAKAIGHIRITGLWREDTRQISDAHTRAEGFDTKLDFWTLWVQVNDPAFARQLERDGVSLSERIAELMERPSKFYDAWALQFERVDDATDAPDRR